MKQLTCEMCGGTDLIKQDGVFVCQTCGCKYSTDEAKKMMIEGAVEVTGTVKVDDSAEKQTQISNFLELAKSALAGSDSEGVVSYCDKILEIDPDNYEAWMLRAKSAGWSSTLNQIKIPQALIAAKRAVNLAPDEKKPQIAKEIYVALKAQIVALLSICSKISSTTGCQYVHTVMLHWQSLLTDIPFLPKELIKEEIDDCKTMCKNSKSAFMPQKRIIYAAYFAYNHNISYDIMFANTLAEKLS